MENAVSKTATREIRTFGDVRKLLIDTIVDLREDRIPVARGMAIAATVKVLNDNIQVEINAAKMAMATEGKVHSFGEVVGMGRRIIGQDSTPMLEQ